MVARVRPFGYARMVAHAGAPDKDGLTAVVTWAARGLGREIATALGEIGATVYVTDGSAWDGFEPPVLETAERVHERGGVGFPVVLDHADDGAVGGLFERIRAERGSLDLLVANPFDGPAPPFRGGPFWTIPLEHWHDVFGRSLRGQLVAARLAAPLLVARHGLIVLTCYNDPDAEVMAEHLFFDVAMNAVTRLARGIAHDLRPHGITALALACAGLARTRAAADGHPDDRVFAGHAVRALLEDPAVARHAGRTVRVAELAEECALHAHPGWQNSPASVLGR